MLKTLFPRSTSHFRLLTRSRSGVLRNASSFRDVYERSLDCPESFWAHAAQVISWYSSPQKILDRSESPCYTWFPDGEMNTCYNAVDRHVEQGYGDRVALFWDSPEIHEKAQWTYAELMDQVSSFADVLRARGVRKGDRVLIYMPMIGQAVIAMLACARLGAIHSVVFGGFSSKELATRIDHATPKVIVAADWGMNGKEMVRYLPLLSGALRQSSHQPRSSIVYQRPSSTKQMLDSSTYLDWDECMSKAGKHDCVPVKSTDPLYILYTSGTTGDPKGIVRDNGGHSVALTWSMTNVMNTDPGETYWAASDIGWIVGHSYSVYAPLLHGCSSVIYEGKPVGTPDAGAFWRIVSEYGVNTMFTAPTALRAIRRMDPNLDCCSPYNLESLRALFVAGERADPATVEFFTKHLNLPVIDNWWQTETGAPIASRCEGINRSAKIKYGSTSRPVPGYDIRVMSNEGEELKRNTTGNLVAKLPLPPAAFPTLYKNKERYVSNYMSKFPGYYETGDAGHIDDDGYVHVMSRTDNIINVAGHRLCTGAIEEAVLSNDYLVECSVVGVADSIKGEIPIGLVVLRAGVVQHESQVKKEVVKSVRDFIGPVAAFKNVLIIDQLPKTRSGKILRGTIKAIAENRAYKVPATIENESVLEDVKTCFQSIGFATGKMKLAET